MSNASKPFDFSQFVPGFDFLKNLAGGAASGSGSVPGIPSLASWVAPTLSVEEVDKRIQELKTVQYWLEQNGHALKATIQALEVQKMTLATLKGMNFNMGDVANAFKLKVADSVAGGVQRVADKARTFSGLEVPPSSFGTGKPAAKAASTSKAKAPAAGKAAAAPAGVVDPMQWWGALTQQFQAIATDAMKDAAKKAAMDTTKNLATGLAKDAMKTATGMATGMARNMAETAGKTMAGGARAAMNTALRSSQGWPTPAAGKTPAKTAGNAAAKTKPKAPARKVARKTAR